MIGLFWGLINSRTARESPLGVGKSPWLDLYMD
jgi:hypothetical protein